MRSLDVFCPYCGASNGQETELCFACGSSLLDDIRLPDTSEKMVVTVSQEQVLQQRYRILEKVGEGGFSAVYRAEDLKTRNIVAVKAIRLQGLTVQEKIEATDAFNREVQMLTKLEHKHLPRLYDHFSDTECWYMVMDFIAGTTLEKRMERRKGTPLPLEEVFDIGLILCHVLAYLHSHQPPIIFRDLKPANIILTRDGRLFLIDFGIARRYKPGQNRDTMPFGSPGYAAPEQYGKAQTTPLADIYSLGVILHQLLSGEDPSLHPFRFAPLHDQHDPARSALNALIQRMVHTDPVQRPGNISIVKRELQMIAMQRASQWGLHSSAPPLTHPYRTGGTIPHRPASAPSRPIQAPSIWSTGVQAAIAAPLPGGQVQVVQTRTNAYTYARHQQKQFNTASHMNIYALASLISGLLGIFLPLFLCGFISTNMETHSVSPLIVLLDLLLLIPAIMSIIFGHLGRHHARKQAGKSAGTDVANAGLLLGYAFGSLYILFLLFMFSFTWGVR